MGGGGGGVLAQDFIYMEHERFQKKMGDPCSVHLHGNTKGNVSEKVLKEGQSLLSSFM